LDVADRIVFVGPNSGHIDKLRQGEARDRLFGFQPKASAFVNNDVTPGELIYFKAGITDPLLRKRQAYAPDKPFLMYWAPGATHGPHHIFKEWADKYTGKFDEGWDVLRERTFKRQKELSWIPANAELTPVCKTSEDETLLPKQ
jgi:arylsulfatase A-like enzyme